MQTVDVPGELFNAINFATTLDLHRNGLAIRIATQQIHRANGSGVFATNQCEARLNVLG